MKCIVILNQSMQVIKVFFGNVVLLSVSLFSLNLKKLCERGGVYLPILLSGEEYYMPVFF